MFRGCYPARVDEKGRLKIPVDFKREIDERYGSGKFYITSLNNGGNAEIFPMKEWEAVEAAASSKPTTDPATRKFFDHTNYWGQEVEMDAQGRVLLPARVREKAGLDGAVEVAGGRQSLKVRNAERYEQEVQQQPLTDDDLSKLGF